MTMPDTGPPRPAARTPSPWAFVTVNPLSVTWELVMTTAAKMVCVPSPGRVTLNVGVTPVSSMVARWPTSDSGLASTTCSWYVPAHTTTVPPERTALTAD